MKVFSDVVDAIVKQGRWGTFNIDIPFCMLPMDSLEIDGGKVFVATNHLHFNEMADVICAIECGYLEQEGR